jgi:hypothetical protein
MVAGEEQSLEMAMTTTAEARAGPVPTPVYGETPDRWVDC